MGINSPKGPDDLQGDVSIPELIRFIEDNRYVAGFNDLTTMGDDNIRRFKEILHLKPDATIEELGQAARKALFKFEEGIYTNDDVLSLDQIEGLPVGENAEQIIDSTRLNLHVAKLAEQKPEVEKTCANSEIKEERTFSKEDILKLIALFAMTNKLELNDLKVSKIINNEQGVMLALEVKSPNPDGGYQQISYMIKGIANGGQLSRTTAIDRSFWDKDDTFEGAGIIAEYLEGKWRFNS